MQHGKLRAHRCSVLVQRVFQLQVRPQHLFRRTQSGIIPRRGQQHTRSERKRSEAPETWSQTQTKMNKNKDDDEAREDPLRDLPEWLEELKNNSVFNH